MTDTGTVNIPFSGLFARVNGLSAKRVALVATLVFAVLSSALIIFHEPWLDEAQAWLIARDASYYDMLFKLPHIEGHIAFWWLILSVPAKLGVPYEIGLKAVNILIAVLACAVFEFKSPFPNAFKIVFPFTYFFFYQYSVIARPYMLLILALFLVAVTFAKREEKPLWHLLALALLCLADTFGIAIAGGIALGWVIRLLKNIAKKNKDNTCRNVKQAVCLFALLLLALFLMWSITPSSDASATESITAANVVMTFIAEIFVLPSELCFTSFLQYGILNLKDISPFAIALTAVISIAIWFFFVKAVMHRDILADIIMPVLMFIALGSFYIYSHHYGLYLMVGIYCAWISLETRSEKKASGNLTSVIGYILCAVSLFAGLIWTGFASVNDICHPYWVSRDLYSWVEANKLEDAKWFAAWDIEVNEDTEEIIKMNTAVTRETVPVNPYMPSKRPINFNNEGYTYALFRDNTEEQNKKDIEEWKKEGEPDLILCSDILETKKLMGIMGYGSTYDIVYVKECRNSWKTDFTKGGVIVLARRDNGLDITGDLEDMPSILGMEG